MAFSKRELCECAQRELKKRRENYPTWVRDGKMTEKISSDQIAKMEAIYRVLARMDDAQIKNIQDMD